MKILVTELKPGMVLRLAPKVEVLGWHYFWTNEQKFVMVKVGVPFKVPAGIVFEPKVKVSVMDKEEIPVKAKTKKKKGK